MEWSRASRWATGDIGRSLISGDRDMGRSRLAGISGDCWVAGVVTGFAQLQQNQISEKLITLFRVYHSHSV